MPLQGEAAGTWAFKRLVVAEDMVEGLGEKLGVRLQRLGKLSGAELAGCQYRHPLFDRSSPVLVGGDYITTESGTGLVHTAPGHGQEDYLVRASQKNFGQDNAITCLPTPCTWRQGLTAGVAVQAAKAAQFH